MTKRIAIAMAIEHAANLSIINKGDSAESIKDIINNAWHMSEKCKCYKDTVISLVNGMPDNPRLRFFLVAVCNLDCNSRWFYNNLESVCDKHIIK